MARFWVVWSFGGGEGGGLGLPGTKAKRSLWEYAVQVDHRRATVPPFSNAHPGRGLGYPVRRGLGTYLFRGRPPPAMSGMSVLYGNLMREPVWKFTRSRL